MNLVTLRPGVAFERDAAASWARMEAERGRPLDVNRSTVSRAEQQEKRDAYLAYLDRRGPWAPRALDPDDSWHCEPKARAADTDDDEWIRAHPDHGWRFVVEDEKWHAQYYPQLDKHRGEGIPAARPQEDDMSPEERKMLTELHKELVEQPGAGWTRAAIVDMAARVRKLEANDEALQYVLDGKEVPADVSARQGGPRASYWRKLGRWLAGVRA